METTTCSSCEKAYSFNHKNAYMVIFLTDSECNHIVLTCTHCKVEEIMYVRPDACCKYLDDMRLNVFYRARATDERRALAAERWAEHDLRMSKPKPMAAHPEGLPAGLTAMTEADAAAMAAALESDSSDESVWAELGSNPPSSS